MVRMRGFLLTASRANGLAAILARILSGLNSDNGIGPIRPNWLRVGVRNTGMAPHMMIECSTLLWQFRSTTTMSSGATLLCHTILLLVLVPLVTKYR